jgi:hypothetical protein
MDLWSEFITYLYWYLGIGASLVFVTAGGLQIKKRLFPSFAQKLQAATAADKKKAFNWGDVRELLGGAALVIAVWPLAIGVLAHDRWSSSRHSKWSSLRDEDPQEDFDAYQALVAQVTVEQAERDNLIIDAHCPAAPFGHLHHGWCRFLEKRTENAELWSFEKERRSSLLQGYAWVKDGQIQAEFVAYG